MPEFMAFTVKRVLKIFKQQTQIRAISIPYTFPVDINHLLAFERVVREGSFSRAAWALGVSQPTISTRIQHLETEVGGALFRRGRKVILTERGVRFLPHVRKTLANLNDGLEAARLDAGAQGRLTIGVLRSLTGNLFGPALRRFYQQCPEVECYAQEGDHWQLLELLTDGVIELALVCWPVQNPLLADLTPIFRLREDMVLVVNPKHELAALERVTQEDVIRFADPFLLLRWWQTTPLEITSLAARARASIDAPMETGLHLVKHANAAGIFPKMMVRAALERNELHEVHVQDLPPLFRDTALVHLTRRDQLSTLAERMVQALVLEARLQKLELTLEK
jgi:LysR family transcriptional regulator, low CO2-responsive transcriptional regulator